EIAPEGRDTGRYALRRTVAERHHGDHRADADHDPERRQHRSHHVAADFPQRQQHGVRDHAAPLRTSDSMRPSWKRTYRSAYAAMYSSCVTRTMVMPRTRLS